MNFDDKKEIDIQAILSENSRVNAENARKNEEIAALKAENEALENQLKLLRKQIFGSKTEKTEVVIENAEQLSLFNEAEEKAEITLKEAEVKSHKRKAKRTREEIYQALPVEEVVEPVENKTCDECGAEMKTVGNELIREELVYVPAKMFRRIHYAEVVKCPVCGVDESKDNESSSFPTQKFKRAVVSAPTLPGSMVSPELLAHILWNKYVQGVPLHRQQKEFKALGAPLSDTTMANWVIEAAAVYAEPVYEAMKKELLGQDVIHADETVVQVLHEPGRKATNDSRMWVYTNTKSDSAHNLVLFNYTETRAGANAVNFLGENYSGTIMCDGFDGYNRLKNATRAGCWAHMRRKFVDALPKEKELQNTSAAAKGVEFCNQLYRLEREYAGVNENGEQIKNPLTMEELLEQRQERSKPVFEAFYAWLESTNATNDGLRKAFGYAKNEKKFLAKYLDDPRLPIDNNKAENAIRPFVVGRKGWLFCTSVDGAKASAMWYSLAVTASANGLDVEKYFTRLFKEKEKIMPW